MRLTGEVETMTAMSFAWMTIGALLLGLVAPAAGERKGAEEKGASRAPTTRLTTGGDPRPTNGGQIR